MRLSQETVCRILHCLVEGNSVRGTARPCDVEKRTVLTILKLAGENCERLLTEKIHNVKVQDCLELDEVWTYVGCHQKRLTPGPVAKRMHGDAYTYICVERSSRLVVAWQSRQAGSRQHRGLRIQDPMGDSARHVRREYEPCSGSKMFHATMDVIPESYRPAKFVSAGKDAISGNPDLDRAGTSHVERKNGTLRQ